MDVDLSDIGFLSVRPYDLKVQGYPDNLFDGKEFRTSTNLDELPQIRTQNKSVDVVPFWGDDEVCSVGICRVDFNIGNDLGANTIFMGSIFTDSDDNALKIKCGVKKKMGEQGQLVTGPGQVDIIKTVRDVNNNLTSLEYLQPKEIDEDGVFVITLPMYYDRIITNEFGNIVKSSDPTKGIPTKGDYRFKLKFNNGSLINGGTSITTASLIIPSINHVDIDKSIDAYSEYHRFSIEEDYLNTLKSSTHPKLLKQEFHTFEWKQVYTTSQYIRKNDKKSTRFDFIGLKDCGPMDFSNDDDDDNDEDNNLIKQYNSLPYTTGIKNFGLGKTKFKLCFFDAWLNGSNYMFKFSVEQDNLRGLNFCGRQNLIDDSKQKDCKCNGTGEINQDLHRCTIISPNDGYDLDSNNNIIKSDGKQTGGSDTGEFIYCNFGLSTKIINIGTMGMCGELLDDLKKLNTNTFLKKYNNTNGIGTGKEYGLDVDGITINGINTPTIDVLSPTSYKDARDLINYFSDSKKGKLEGKYFQEDKCHEKEFKFYEGTGSNDNSVGYYIKELCKIHIEVDETVDDPDGGTQVSVNGTPLSIVNPIFNRFSKDKTYGDTQDETTSRKREKNNNPYFYFGLNPGKTALDKLRRDYF
jgi:hypothetical protein